MQSWQFPWTFLGGSLRLPSSAGRLKMSGFSLMSRDLRVVNEQIHKGTCLKWLWLIFSSRMAGAKAFVGINVSWLCESLRTTRHDDHMGTSGTSTSLLCARFNSLRLGSSSMPCGIEESSLYWSSSFVT